MFLFRSRRSARSLREFDIYARHLKIAFATVRLPESSFISENPIVAKGQYWMKIVFVFILILFIDSVNRVYRVQQELSAATEKMSNGYARL